MSQGFGKRTNKQQVKQKKRSKPQLKINRPTNSVRSKNLFQSALIAYQNQKLEQAKHSCLDILKLNSDDEDALYLLGSIERKQGNLNDAIIVYQKLVDLQPQNASLWSNLGVLCIQQRQLERAIECLEKAIAIDPNFAQAYSNLGQLNQDLGKTEIAQKYLEQATSLNPKDTTAQYNLGNVYKHQGNLSLAIATYQKAMKLNPYYDGIYNNLGNTYLEKGEVESAFEYYQKALQLQLNKSNAYDDLDNIYFQAVDPYKKSNNLKSANVMGEHNLLFALHYPSDFSPQDIFINHRHWGHRYRSLLEQAPSYQNILDPNRRLKIGYVSGDFKTHSVSYFFEPLLVNRDRANFEVTCYANNKYRDEVTEKLRALADNWRDIAHLDDATVAQMIHQDGIDILVDLAGHTLGNRLSVFARKPAPLQITYLGYPNTTGLEAMDYRLSDFDADPPGMTEALHTEELIRLEKSFLCYQPPANAPKVRDLPARKQGYITFGSFNSLPKVSQKTIDCWIEILHQVPESRLTIKAKSLQDRGAKERIYDLFAAARIDRQRLDLRGWLADTNNHLDLYNEVDIALDTYPYHGTTTTCEALYMGVPVITLAGASHVSRVGVSLLSSVGLNEFIANSSAEYISKAIDLANNWDYLAELRRGLRDRLLQSPLTNGKEVTYNLESAYRQIWRKFCEVGASATPELSNRSSNSQDYFQVAQTHQRQGRNSEAIIAYQQAIALNPQSSDAYNNLGNIYNRQGNYTQAIDCYQKAIEIKPDYAGVYNNLASIHTIKGNVSAAIECYQKAIAIKPTAELYSNLASVYKDKGDIEQTLAYYRQSLKLKPDYAAAWHNLLFCLNYDWQLTPQKVFQKHLEWAKQAKSLQKIHYIRGEFAPQKKLRIGYVSADFNHHPVAYFVEPILSHHNPQDFSIFCYHNSLKKDQVSQRLQQLVSKDNWRDIYHLDDRAVVNRIKADAIDILVDLSGHSADNRLEVFAQKPAPIQVNYLGYPNTTGLDTIDYRFSDRYADPVGKTEAFHTEKLIRLANSFICYQPPADAPPVTPPPVTQNKYITFGSFNNLAKVNPKLINCWAKILQGVAGSRLILKSRALKDRDTQERIYHLFANAGIERDRIILRGWIKKNSNHLALYNEVDIALDTYPYHGTTTTCEALYMGVPVITLAGASHVSRVGVSLLSSVGLTELIANSQEEYVERAISLASNSDRLAQLRSNIRPRLQKSPLTDGKKFTLQLESTYRHLWQQYCQQSYQRTEKTSLDMVNAISQSPRVNNTSPAQTYTFLIEGSRTPIYQRIITAFSNAFQEFGHRVVSIKPYQFQGEGYLKEIERINPDFCILTNPISSLARYQPSINKFIFEKISSKLIFIHHDNIFSNLNQLSEIKRKLTALKATCDRSYHFCLEYTNYLDLRSLGFPQVYCLPHASEFTTQNSSSQYTYQTSFVGHLTPDVYVPDNFPHSAQVQSHIWQRISDLNFNLDAVATQYASDRTNSVVTNSKFLSLKYYYISLLHRFSQPFRGEIIKRIANTKLDIIGGDPAYLHGVKQQKIIKRKNINYHPPVQNYALTQDIYRHSKINLNITSLQFDDAVINRVIDVAAVGGFILTDWKSGLEKITSVAQEISYKTVEELNHKLAYYLDPSRDGQRREIAQTLHEDIKQNCNYQTIVNLILEKIEMTSTLKNKPLKIDLGCGRWKPAGFIGVDCSPNPQVDVVADLNRRFPFADHSVELIRGHDVVEHLPDRIHTMNEIWRIAQPKATVDILVPSTDGRGAFQDPTHISFWNLNSFRYYCIEYPAYLQLCHSYGFKGAFKIISLKERTTEDNVIHVRAILQAVK